MDIKKQEGFAGQVSIVLPDSVRIGIQGNPLINDLYLTDIGYYPRARHHFRERKNGADEDILIYVVKGRGKLVIENKQFFLENNQFIVIPKGSGHWYRADENDPWSIYWVHYMGKKRNIMASMLAKVYTIVPSQNARVNDRLALFDEIIEIMALGFSQENLEYANLCLAHLLASFKYIDQFRKINEAGEKDMVKKAMIYMKMHIDKLMTLENMAKEQGMSVSHFSRVFRQRTRSSPMDYFIHMKIQHACQLLNYSGLRVHEVARAIGYEDAYYFSRIFKRVMGLSPVKYKLQGRK